MPHTIGFVANDGTLAHYKMLATIRDFASSNGWEVLRYNTAAANRELILKGVGFTGDEEIFVGFRTYQSADADIYNLVAATFLGYVAGNTFDTQPGAMLSGVPCHNNRVDYWLTLNPQRIALAMKVGTPVYESAYVGKFLPYARPSQYPYPVICAGMLVGTPLTRFSDLNHSMPYKGARQNFRMRFNDGVWKAPDTWPWINQYLTSAVQARDTGGYYPLSPVELSDGNGTYGCLDGISFISGFDNAVENTLTVDGHDHVVIQDVNRTGHADYYAMRLD